MNFIERLRVADAMTIEATLLAVALAFVVLAGFLFWVGILAGRFILDARAGRALRLIEGSREGVWLTIDYRAVLRHVEKRISESLASPPPVRPPRPSYLRVVK